MPSQWLIHLSGPCASDQACWPEIIKLGIYLQTHHDLTFPEISTLLDLKTGRCIYDDTKTRYPVRSLVPCATSSAITSRTAIISRLSVKLAFQ